MSQSVMRLKAEFLGAASVVGSKENEGPLGACFDRHGEDDRFGQKTWEAAESELQRRAFAQVLAKTGRKDADVDLLFAGDLLNQCVASAYGLIASDIPYCGLYGACSTVAEGILLASLALTAGGVACAGVVTSSHYCAAERQYRTPLEYGAQRSPTAQWTVTGAGAFLLGPAKGSDVRVTRGVFGKVHDSGVSDAGNMGAAMAGAAADTLLRFLGESGEAPDSYDRIVTGDLGFEGGDLFCAFLDAAGCSLGERYADCGRMIYDRERQDVHSGGSGCGCSAVTLAGYFLPRLRSGEYRRILFLPTGALMSPDSLKQKRTIPAVAHLIELEAPRTDRDRVSERKV